MEESDYPKTLMEFEKRFSSEEACREYLFTIRWPERFICPHCSFTEYWKMNQGFYRCRQCRYRFSGQSGTIFHNSRIPLRIWFRAIWQVVGQKQGISALGLQRILGLSRYETAWLMMHRLRTVMIRPERTRLNGIVQADEIFIGGPRPGKRGRGAANKTLVLIMVEAKDKKAGRIRLLKIKNASAKYLTKALKQNVDPGSEIHTDGWEGYGQLSSSGYERKIIRKTADLGDNLLPLANRVASLLKRWLQGTHQGAPLPKHLNYYLDEFVFRFNRRTSRSRGLLFYRLIQQAVQADPVKKEDILKGLKHKI